MGRSHEKDRIYLSVKNTVSDLKLLDDYDTEEPWKSAVIKQKFLLDRILKEIDPPELSDPGIMMVGKPKNNDKQL